MRERKKQQTKAYFLYATVEYLSLVATPYREDRKKEEWKWTSSFIPSPRRCPPHTKDFHVSLTNRIVFIALAINPNTLSLIPCNGGRKLSRDQIDLAAWGPCIKWSYGVALLKGNLQRLGGGKERGSEGKTEREQETLPWKMGREVEETLSLALAESLTWSDEVWSESWHLTLLSRPLKVEEINRFISLFRQFALYY